MSFLAKLHECQSSLSYIPEGKGIPAIPPNLPSWRKGADQVKKSVANQLSPCRRHCEHAAFRPEGVHSIGQVALRREVSLNGPLLVGDPPLR